MPRYFPRRRLVSPSLENKSSAADERAGALSFQPPPLQLKSTSEEADNEFFDPTKHAPVMKGKETWTDQELQNYLPKLNSEKIDHQIKIIHLRTKIDVLDKQLETANAEDRPKFEAEKKDIETQIEERNDLLRQTKQDMEMIRNPATSAEEKNNFLARQGSKVSVAETTTTGEVQGGLLGKSTQVTSKAKYDAEKGLSTHSETIKSEGASLEDLGHASSTTTKATKVHSDGGEETSERSKSTSLGLTGVSGQDTSKTTVTDKDGNETSSEKNKSIKYGFGGLDYNNTSTDATKAADGSGKSTTKSTTLKQEGGELNASKGSSTTVTDKDGTETTNSSTLKGGLISGKDGVGAHGGGDVKSEEKLPSGFKTGVQGGLNGRIICNVVKIPKTTPPAYRVLLSVNLGIHVGSSFGGEKTSEATGSTGGGSLEFKAGVAVIMNSSKKLNEAETTSYLSTLRGASNGTSGGSKELAVIQTGVTKGWDAARQMFIAMSRGVMDKDFLNQMENGDKYDSTVSTEAGVKASLDGKSGGGFGFGGGGGFSSTNRSTLGVEKKDDKFIFTPHNENDDTWSGDASVGFGGVSGTFGVSHTTTTGKKFQLVLDPKDPKFQEKLAALQACQTDADREAFARNYPDTVKSITDISGEKTTDKAGASVGDLKAEMEFGAGVRKEVTRDSEGNVEKTTTTGENSGSMKGSIGDYSIVAGSKESAKAVVNADGSATLDVNQTDTETNTAKWLEQHVPGAKTGGKNEGDPGLLSEMTGGAKKMVDTTEKNISGIKMTMGDLGYLAYIAKEKGMAGWMKGCTTPRLMDEWRAAFYEVQKNGFTEGAVANALANFVGKRGPGRDDVIYKSIRKAGDVSVGARYEFPGNLASFKKDFEIYAIGNPRAILEKTFKDKGLEASEGEAAAVLEKLRRLYSAIASSTSFTQKAVQAEMLGAINRSKEQVQAFLRKIKTGSEEITDSSQMVAKYNDHLDNCVRYKFSETDLFNQAASINNEYYVFGSKAVDKAKVIKQIRDLHAVWQPQYEAMGKIAQEHSIGLDRYWKYKPDTNRLLRLSSTGNPGKASEMKPEPAGKFAKKPPVKRAPKDPIGVENKKLQANRQKSASNISARLNPSRNNAYGKGNRLHAWIQYDRKAQAIDAHNRGMVKLKEAAANANRMPQNATILDWETYGFLAANDFSAAAAIFQEGLALYPGGWPPKQ